MIRLLLISGTMVPLLMAGCENSQRVRAIVTHVDGGEATLTIGATPFTPGTSLTIKDGASVYFMHRDTDYRLIDAMNENETTPPVTPAPEPEAEAEDPGEDPPS